MYHGSCLAAWHCFTAGTAQPGLAYILRRKVGQHLRDHRVDALLLLGRRLRLDGARSSRAPQQRLAVRTTNSRTCVPSFFSMAWLFPPPTDTRPALPTGMPTDTPTPVEPPYVLLTESCMPIRTSGLASAGTGPFA